VIVDFRVRPPYGGYLNTNIYRDRERTIAMVKDQGYAPSRSLVNASFEDFLREQDAARVDVSVVPGRYTTPSYGQVSNEDLARLAREHGKKIVCFAAVDTASAQAADDLEVAVKDLGLAGLTLDPGFYDPPRYADDPVFEPLYRRCMKLGVPVAVTYSGHAGPDIGYADPVRIDRVAASFPDLAIIVVHAGWPWVPQILGAAFRRPNLYLSPDMYMVKMPGAGDYVEAANGFLRDRLFFGSSYPFLPFDEAVRYYESLPFRKDVLPGVMGDNAARLLKLR
jgi:predicted TIM-barrel fold metal-dependent hydrolase